jgi:hypothetical protein
MDKLELIIGELPIIPEHCLKPYLKCDEKILGSLKEMSKDPFDQYFITDYGNIFWVIKFTYNNSGCDGYNINVKNVRYSTTWIGIERICDINQIGKYEYPTEKLSIVQQCFYLINMRNIIYAEKSEREWRLESPRGNFELYNHSDELFDPFMEYFFNLENNITKLSQTNEKLNTIKSELENRLNKKNQDLEEMDEAYFDNMKKISNLKMDIKTKDDTIDVLVKMVNELEDSKFDDKNCLNMKSSKYLPLPDIPKV